MLSITVTTSRGVDYRVSKIELPLYLKVLNFFDRHFNYKWLANQVTSHLETKEDKIFRLFEWVHETIRPQPEKLPIIDDHVWNVYVRGYGVSDNFHDLFSTLCNYVGAKSMFLKIKSKDSNELKELSFVKLQRGWVIFDPFYGTYFINEKGGWATVDEIKNSNWKLVQLGELEISNSFYKPFFESLPNIDESNLQRANIQSPMNRLKFQINKWLFGGVTLPENSSIVN